VLFACCDPDGESGTHEKIAKKIGAKIFFARLYKCCAGGLNEHTNGLIRQYLPENRFFQTNLT
jgi:IS30 family transposase